MMRSVWNGTRGRVLGFCWVLLLIFSGLPVLAQDTEYPVGLEEEPTPRPRINLRQALAVAVSTHPTLKQAIAQIEAGEFAVTASTAPWYPSFTFNASSGQSGTDGQPGGLSVVRTGVQRSYGYGISLSQQIYDFGRTSQSIRLSELQLSNTRLGYLQTRQRILDSVVQAYFELLRQDQAITVNQENIRNAEAVLAQARGFLEAGTGAKIGVIQAEANLANAKFGLVQAQGAFGRAKAQLASAMGLDLVGDLLPEETFLEVPNWDTAEVRDLARHARPDVLQAAVEVAQAEARIKLARAEYYPRISASASYSANDRVFPPNVYSYNVGVNLSVPLINEPALSSAVGQAEANHRASLESFRNVELLAIQEATSAFYTLKEAEGRAVSASEALRFATENYRLASERYKVGVGNSLELSQAQQQLIEARTQELQARFDVQNAVATLLRATGQIDTRALLPEEYVVDPIFDIPEKARPE